MNNLGYFSFFFAAANLSNLSYCLFSQEELKFILIKNAINMPQKRLNLWRGTVFAREQ